MPVPVGVGGRAHVAQHLAAGAGRGGRGRQRGLGRQQEAGGLLGRGHGRDGAAGVRGGRPAAARHLLLGELGHAGHEVGAAHRALPVPAEAGLGGARGGRLLLPRHLLAELLLGALGAHHVQRALALVKTGGLGQGSEI